jgi:Skp family chaperone for outer membrane proteins
MFFLYSTDFFYRKYRATNSPSWRFNLKRESDIEGGEHMRKLSRFIVFSVIVTGCVSLGLAQETFDVGIIDSSKVIQTSAEGKKAMFTLKQKEQQIIDGLAKIDKQVKELQSKLDAQKLLLTPESQQQIAFDVEQLRTKRKRAEEDYAKEYKQLEFSLVSKIRNEVFPIIETVAKERNFRLVLDLSVTGAAYVDPVIDITEEVIQRYDEVVSLSE